MTDPTEVTPGGVAELESAGSLYAVLVLLVAGGVLGTIQILGSATPANGEPPPPVPRRTYAPLAGLPDPAVARVASSVQVIVPTGFKAPEVFPCSECHDPEDDDLEPRTLEIEHKTLHLDHGPSRGWCFDCHDPAERDSLRLADGTRVDYAQADLLCAQCHGRIHREWERGLHGKRTGYWSGAKRVWSCGQCHDAHAPRFAPLIPLPPPARPESNR